MFIIYALFNYSLRFYHYSILPNVLLFSQTSRRRLFVFERVDERYGGGGGSDRGGLSCTLHRSNGLFLSFY